jgi:hypothetical protein
MTLKKVRKRQRKASNRFFYDAVDMAECKREEAIEHSVAKREGKKLAGVKQGVWACGCGCVRTYPLESCNATLPKKSKGQREKNQPAEHQCIHFKGKAIK